MRTRISFLVLVLIAASFVFTSPAEAAKRRRHRPRAQHAAMGFPVAANNACRIELRECLSGCSGPLRSGCVSSCEVSCFTCDYKQTGVPNGHTPSCRH